MNGTKTFRKQCSDKEFPAAEAAWQAEGFRPTEKKNEKDLLPMEYLKTSSTGSVDSFGGKRNWLLVRREK